MKSLVKYHVTVKLKKKKGLSKVLLLKHSILLVIIPTVDTQ